MSKVTELYARGCTLKGNIPKCMPELTILSCAGMSVELPNLLGMPRLKEVYSSRNQKIIVSDGVLHEEEWVAIMTGCYQLILHRLL